MDRQHSDNHGLSDGAHNIIQTFAEQQPQTPDVQLHSDEYDDMPGLQEVSDSSDNDSNDDRINEVEMQTVDDVLPASTSQPSLLARNNNRRARVDDDEDAERDRRHPSERINTRAASSTTPSQAPTPSVDRRSQGGAPVGHDFGGQRFASNNDQQALHLFQQLMRSQTAQAGQNNAADDTATATNPNPPPNAQQQDLPPGGNRLPGGFFDGVIDIQIGPEIVFGRNGPQQRTQSVQGPQTADGQPPQPPLASISEQARAGIFADLMASIGQLIPGADIDGNEFPIINLGNLGFGFGAAQEKEDPERAKKLVAGLEIVPVGLVRRLERVGGTGGGMGEDMTNGGDAGCAICWDKLLDGDGEGFGKEKEEKAEGGSASTESKYPKIVSLPCAHVFHADCLIPWFSRPRHTTCPTCRFNIDPDNLTYTPMRNRPRAAPAPSPATTGTSEGERQPAADGEQPLPTDAAGNDPQLNAGVNLTQSIGDFLNRLGAELPSQLRGGQPQDVPTTNGEPTPRPNAAAAGNAAPPRLRPPRISVNIIPVVVPVNGASSVPPQQPPNNGMNSLLFFRPTIRGAQLPDIIALGSQPPSNGMRRHMRSFASPPDLGFVVGPTPAAQQVPVANGRRKPTFLMSYFRYPNPLMVATGNPASAAGQNAITNLLMSHIMRQNIQQTPGSPFNSLFPPHFLQQQAAATAGLQPAATGGNPLPTFGANPSIPLGDDPTRPLPVFRRVTYRGPGPFFNRPLPGSQLPYRVLQDPPDVVNQPIADGVRVDQLFERSSSTQPPQQTQQGNENAAPNSTTEAGAPPSGPQPTQQPNSNVRTEVMRFTIDMILDGPIPPLGNDDDLPPLIDSPTRPEDDVIMIEQNDTELDRLMGNMEEVDEFIQLMDQQHQQDVEFLRLRAQNAAAPEHEPAQPRDQALPVAQPAAPSASQQPALQQENQSARPNILPPLPRGMGNGVHFAAGTGRTIHEAFNQLFAPLLTGQRVGAQAGGAQMPASNAERQPPQTAEGAIPIAQQPQPRPQSGQVPPALHMFGDLFGAHRRDRRSRPKGPWTLPPAPGPTLRQRIERREMEAGLRCHDVSCGVGPSDEDPFGDDVANVTATMKQLTIKSKEDKSELCVHRFHGPCLVTAERVALKGADAIVEDGSVEVSCPVCRHVGCVSKEEWDEGVVALT